MTIVLADMDAYLRGRLRKRLEKVSGVTVVGESSNSTETTAMILNRNPDVAIVSSLLEGGSGLDVLRHVRQLMIPPTIIAVRDNPSLDHNNAYSVAGADFIVDKAADDRRIIDIIRLLCDGHRQTDVMDSSFATRHE
ncbi:MAG: response regulator [Nitrospirota bacterium]|nr:response regulator [Nitrospirota bacterium]